MISVKWKLVSPNNVDTYVRITHPLHGVIMLPYSFAHTMDDAMIELVRNTAEELGLPADKLLAIREAVIWRRDNWVINGDLDVVAKI